MGRHNAVRGLRSMPFVGPALGVAVAGLAFPVFLSAALSQGNTPSTRPSVPTPSAQGTTVLPPPNLPPVPQPFTPTPETVPPVPQPDAGSVVRVTPIQIANLPLGVVTFPNGKAMNLNVGMGSAAFRLSGDSQGRLWLMTDRGPSIPCAEVKKFVGMEPEQICAADRNGLLYPLPGFVPSIYAVDIGADNVARINVFIPLKGKSGRPVSGRTGTAGGRGEVSLGIDGKVLPSDPSGLDPEAFVRLSDGTFWVAEEFGPSLVEVAGDGTIRRRLVPANAAADYKDADYDIAPALPPILRQRSQGRGFESLAISPDEKFLYAMMQSPLANPDAAASRHSRNIRIWKIVRETGQVVGQYLYQLDAPHRFRVDNEARERTREDVKVAEIVAIGEDRLMVLERIEKSARLFTIHLDEANRIPPEFDSLEMSPSLEILDGEALTMRGLAPLPKTLVLDTDTLPGLPARIEGVAVMAPNELIVINDNEFGIDGVRNQMFRIILPEPLFR